MMNIEKLFEVAKSKGIQDIQIYLSNSNTLSIEIFEGDIDKYEIAKSSSLTIRGLYNNKMGVYRTEVLEDSLIDEIVDTLIASAKVINSLDDAIIYEGDKEYEDLTDIYNEDLTNLDVAVKIKALKDMDEYLRKYDKRVKNVETMYSESTNAVLLQNSKGLKLYNKANSSYLGGQVIVADGEDQRVGFDVLISNDFNDYNVKELAKKMAEEALNSLGAKPVPSKNYEIVFNNIAFSTLLSAFQGVFSAHAVQKGLSLLKDKLETEVGSTLINIVDDPFMKKSSNSRSFDDEGVATKVKYLVKSGVLKTYLHNLVTAKKSGVKSTGNGFGGGVAAVNLKVEAGKTPAAEMIESIKDGLYITEVQGAHAGANPVSGDFSLQAAGYYVVDGKKVKPVALITVAGNFIDMLKKVVLVGDDLKTTYYGVTCPSIKIESMPVSGS
ncbi:TldD/PmbA family protein [Mycoplasmatota bacterium WC30]